MTRLVLKFQHFAPQIGEAFMVDTSIAWNTLSYRRIMAFITVYFLDNTCDNRKRVMYSNNGG